MLPIRHAWKEGSMMDLIETGPKMELALQDIAPLVEALRDDHALSSPLFQRREQREAAHTSLQGLLAELPRKSIEPLVLALAGVHPHAVRAMQACISAGAWDDDALLRQHWKDGEQDGGEDAGVLMVDGSDFPTQGVHSAGVKRQYWGALGKRAHCQAGVLVGSVSPQGDPLLERRLSLPAAWSPDAAYAERRKQCGIPPAITVNTTPALAEERRTTIVQTRSLRCRWVGADEACGDPPGFLEGVAGLGLWDCAEVAHTTRVWGERPPTHVPPWRGRGRRSQRERLGEGAPKASTVGEVAAALPAAAWTRQTSKAGSQGPRVAECAAIRGVAVRDPLPGPDVWLGLRRHRDTGEVKPSLCHAPVGTAWATQVRMRGRRGPIATCCEDSKPLLGMGDYAVRGWVGWHQQMTLVLLAHFFVVRMRLR
jgi:SRSO17 transposase